MASVQKVTSFIDENAVAVFSKSYCPYCVQLKETLSALGAKFNVIELDEISDGRSLQDALGEKTGQTTVPNVFIGGEHVGGNSDVQKLKRNGLLEGKLKAAGAL